MAGNQRKAVLVAGGKTRVQNVSTEQTIKAAAGILHRIVAANANAAVQTLTVTDGATAQIVLRIPAGDTRSFEIGAEFDTSIKVTPSHADVDALIVWD